MWVRPMARIRLHLAFSWSFSPLLHPSSGGQCNTCHQAATSPPSPIAEPSCRPSRGSDCTTLLLLTDHGTPLKLSISTIQLHPNFSRALPSPFPGGLAGRHPALRPCGTKRSMWYMLLPYWHGSLCFKQFTIFIPTLGWILAPRATRRDDSSPAKIPTR